MYVSHGAAVEGQEGQQREARSAGASAGRPGIRAAGVKLCSWACKQRCRLHGPWLHLPVSLAVFCQQCSPAACVLLMRALHWMPPSLAADLQNAAAQMKKALIF